jgi:Haem-degrading
MQITSDQAEGVVRAAKSKAADIGVAVSVVVMDAAGHLKAFSRMDGAWLGSIDVAMKKAKTSVLFEAETQAIWTLCKPDDSSARPRVHKQGPRYVCGRHSSQGRRRTITRIHRRLRRTGRARPRSRTRWTGGFGSIASIPAHLFQSRIL